MTTSLADLAALDAADPLAGFRDAFDLPDGVIYMDGNSLGAVPKAAAARIADTVTREWGRDLIRSWTSNDWIASPQRIGDKIARLIGAAPGELVAADSTSVNLYKLVVAALRAAPSRTKVLSEPGNFPTDLYVIQGAVEALGGGRRLELRGRDQIVDAIDEDTALVVLTHIHYKSAEIHDMAAVTAAAHAKGALILWDLSHSAGVLPVDLNGVGADLAVGCGYKHLNGGPGAPAFLFVARRHQDALASPLTGWMGHARPFDFTDDYAPATGVDRFLCGTPPILGMAALEVGVDLMLQADMAQMAAKSRRLGDLFIRLVQERIGEALVLASPGVGEARGGHVSFRHPEGYAVMQALIARGVIGDFRAPDILRFGLTPLYQSYQDIGRAVDILAEILEGRLWDRPEFHARARVT